jgi:hypothetical protein
VEANPALIEIIRETHRLNHVSAEIHNAVALSASGRASLGLIDQNAALFYQRKNFWGSSLSQQPAYASTSRVPILDFQGFINEIQPTVIVADIEGGELSLFDDISLAGVLHVFLEIHKTIIGLKGITHVSATLAEQGLHYDPDFSIGAVVMFSRDPS